MTIVQKTEIRVLGKDSLIKGHLVLTPGSLNYYRKNAHCDSPTHSLTYQQLFALLESQIGAANLKKTSFKPDQTKEAAICMDAIPSKEDIHQTLTFRQFKEEAEMYDGQLLVTARNKKGKWGVSLSLGAIFWAVEQYVQKMVSKEKSNRKLSSDRLIVPRATLIGHLRRWLAILE